eukprot:403345596
MRISQKNAKIKCLLVLSAFLLVTNISCMKIEDNTLHEVLLDQRDYIKAEKESEIKDDDNQNSDNFDSDLDEYDSEMARRAQMQTVFFDADQNTIVEEIGDAEGEGFYQKKVIQNGPGFKSVTIVSRGGGGPIGLPSPADFINSFLGDVVGQSGDMNQGDPNQDGQQQNQGNGGVIIVNNPFALMAQIMGQIQQQRMRMMQEVLDNTFGELIEEDEENADHAIVPQYKQATVQEDVDNSVKNVKEDTITPEIPQQRNLNQQSSQNTVTDNQNNQKPQESQIPNPNSNINPKTGRPKITAAERQKRMQQFMIYAAIVFVAFLIVFVGCLVSCRLNAKQNADKSNRTIYSENTQNTQKSTHATEEDISNSEGIQIDGFEKKHLRKND